MCLSYSGMSCTCPGCIKPNAISCNCFDVQSADSIGHRDGLQILGSEELFNSASNQLIVTRATNTESKSNTKEESSFADYEGSNFVIDDDSSLSSKVSVESSENTFLDCHLQYLLEQVGEEDEDEEGLAKDLNELCKDFKEPIARDEWSVSRRSDTFSLPDRLVTFSNRLRIREYAVTVGCHSKNCWVCPWELSWEYIEKEGTIPAEKYNRCGKDLSNSEGTLHKINANFFHDSFDGKLVKTSSLQQSMKSMLPPTVIFQGKHGHAEIHPLRPNERRERIATVLGISVEQVKEMEIERVLHEVNDSIHTIEVIAGRF